jgi:3-deoxy-manno-octulosonate cytidylyltransferase (CMP-KDO synthetase)
MKVLGIIPARYASSRFPGKPLAMIAGKSMIERVCRQAEKAETLDDIVVATDDERIAACVRDFGGKVIMTTADCPTGTDRTALVAEVMEDYDVVLNIQGDEPLLEPEHIDSAVRLIKRTPEADITTLVRPARYPGEADDYNCVKVVLGTNGRILYFSRGRVPYCRDKDLQSKFEPGGENPYRIHIGLYVYRREKLLKMVSLPTVMAERCEGLEQLRALDSGITMYAAEVGETASIGVDTPDDIILVEKVIEQHGLE